MKATLKGDRGTGVTVLYIPGIDGTGELLLGTAARLESRFRLMRLAYRVEGPASEDSYPGLAASISDLCRENGVERAVVIAESFGGAVGLQLALDFPELVQALMVVNSFAHNLQPVRLGMAHGLSGLVPRWLFKLGRRTFSPRALFGPRGDAEALRAFQKLTGTFFDEAYRRRIRMIRSLDLRPRLHELRMPVLLLASDEDRVVPSVQAMGEIAQLVPTATLELVPRAGHLILPLAEEPWLERVESLLSKS